MAGAAGSEVKILGAWPSPYVMRPRIALALKGVEYEFVEETFEKSELLLKSNPVYKKIPVMLHRDHPICESLVIVQYIDEAWPGSGPALLPSDPHARAVQRFWAVYIDDKWFPAMSGISKSTTEEAKQECIAKTFEGLALLEDAFVKISNGKRFFGGDGIGYLDIALGCFLAWLRVTEQMHGMKLLDEVKTPHLTAWADRFCAVEAVKPVMPATDKLAEFAKMLLARVKAAAAAAAPAK